MWRALAADSTRPEDDLLLAGEYGNQCRTCSNQNTFVYRLTTLASSGAKLRVFNTLRLKYAMHPKKPFLFSLIGVILKLDALKVEATSTVEANSSFSAVVVCKFCSRVVFSVVNCVLAEVNC